MAVCFQISETLSTEDWEAFQLGLLSRRAGRGVSAVVRGANAAERWSVTSLGVLLIAVGAFCLWSIRLFPVEDKASFGMMGLHAFLGLSLIFFGIRNLRRRKSSSLSRVLPPNDLIGRPMEFTFEEDAFFVRVEQTSASYRYHVLAGLWEDKERFCLHGSGNIRFVLRKDAFTRGDPAQFGAFAEEKIEQAAHAK